MKMFAVRRLRRDIVTVMLFAQPGAPIGEFGETAPPNKESRHSRHKICKGTFQNSGSTI